MIIEINNNSDLLEYNLLNISIVSFDFINNPFKRYLLYVNNDYILGFLCYEDIFDRFEIDNIFVNIENRRKGIGFMLIKKLIANAKSKRVKNITLEVNKENFRAINLYKKVGFVEKAIREKYYNGIDGILMEKEMM